MSFKKYNYWKKYRGNIILSTKLFVINIDIIILWFVQILLKKKTILCFVQIS